MCAPIDTHQESDVVIITTVFWAHTQGEQSQINRPYFNFEINIDFRWELLVSWKLPFHARNRQPPSIPRRKQMRHSPNALHWQGCNSLRGLAKV